MYCAVRVSLHFCPQQQLIQANYDVTEASFEQDCGTSLDTFIKTFKDSHRYTPYENDVSIALITSMNRAELEQSRLAVDAAKVLSKMAKSSFLPKGMPHLQS